MPLESSTIELTASRPLQATGVPPLPVRRFRPRLALGYQQELRVLCERIIGVPPDSAKDTLDAAVLAVEAHRDALSAFGLTPTDLIPTLQYATTLKVLRDLVVQGWTVRVDDEGIILDAPGYGGVRIGDPEPQKAALRRSFAFARDAQLAQASTQDFIAAMERRGIEKLFANGNELAGRLTADGVTALAPFLQLVEPKARDETTGLLLQDIWRYARHYWSIPYQSTPGRNMFYLVRDRGADGDPLIGIAALGNPVLGLSQRDDYFGWSLESLRRRVIPMADEARQRLAAHLFAVIERGINDTYSADLWPSGVPVDWRKGVAELEELERASATQRLAKLADAGDDRDADYRLIRAAHSDLAANKGEIDWESLAQTALYRRKRAGTLADLLLAYGAFRQLGFSTAGGDLEHALETEEGARAVEVALRRIKQGVIASSVMELITCGAVPPYRDILGGKLAAMMMLSGEVVADFVARYEGRVSLIASALAGRAVVRPARLAAITTSSLYAVGSSQYNRIKVASDGRATGYKRIGKTESFGTVHFAPDTVADLTSLARLIDNRRAVNNLFGEGTSPKLRQVRAGLEALGLDGETFLRHHSPRLLFAAPLAANFDDVMLGLTDNVDHVLPSGIESTALIVEQWRRRWLEPRIARPEILERLRQQAFDNFCLGNDVASLAVGDVRRAGQVKEGTPLIRAEAQRSQTFIERLYRSSNSYADRLTQEELDWIHVDLGVDSYLLDRACDAKQIIVTGNPGDGKTHLIERLRPALEEIGAKVLTDANACSNDEIIAAWEQCRDEKRAFVLAINEWPLFVVHRLARERDFEPVDEALRQVTSARYFVAAQEPEEAREGVVVIDLSLRNLLSRPVIEAVIERLSQEHFYKGLNPADPVYANRAALTNPQIRDRLVELLEVVSARVGHVTMRQLVGFIAYLLTGGEPEAERLRAGQDASGLAYSTLAFKDGVGPLFDAIRAVADPAGITHPDWDDRLWIGDTDPADWIGQPPPGPLALPDAERDDAYRSIKRRFYFEHKRGGELLALIPRDEREFEETLRAEEQGKVGLVRELVLDINRFYEPDCPDDERDRLQLWQSHRFDVRAPQAFVALHSLPHQQLRIEPAKFAPWVSSWLPDAQRDRRSFALVARKPGGGDVAVLEIDRDLYLTLYEAQRGLGRASWSRTATRRITRFVDQIHGAVESTSGVEDIRIRNVETDLDERFAIQRQPARYQL